MNKPLSRRSRTSSGSVDLPRKGGGDFVGGGKTLPRRLLTSPSMGEVDAVQGAAAGEGAVVKKDFVRRLRRNMTVAERRLWAALRAKRFEKYKFRRQLPVGKYVADFMCFEKRLIVEADGGQHSESAHDAVRDAWLKSQGFRVLRFWNFGVYEELDGVLLTILDTLNDAHSSPASPYLLPQGEKGKMARPSPVRGEGKDDETCSRVGRREGRQL